MDAVSLTIGLSTIAVSLLTAGLSVPMATGRTRRNHLYGARLSASMASDEAWDAVNRYAGRQLIFASVPVLIFGVVALFLPFKQYPLLTALCPAIVLASVLTAAVRIVMFDAEYDRRFK